MAKTVKEILNESRSLRFDFQKPAIVAEIGPQQFSKPLPWKYYFGQVLGAVGIQDLVWNVYFDEDEVWRLHPEDIVPKEMTVIIHGHSRVKFCSTISLCHILGYKPSEPFSSVLQKQWEKFGYGTV